MKQSVLGQPAHTYKTKLNRRIARCAAIFAITVGFNIIVTFLRTDHTHTLMLILNIAADILCGCFLLYQTDARILPALRLYRLFCRNRELFSGTVTQISSGTQRYMDIDCHMVTVDNRKVFLPAGTLQLQQEHYSFWLVSNIIVEAAQ